MKMHSITTGPDKTNLPARDIYRRIFAGMMVVLAIISCGRNDSDSSLQYRNMTQDEAMQDFHELVGKVRGFYGPLHYKEERFGFNLNDIVAGYEKILAAAHNDDEVYAVYTGFLGRLQDAHVSIEFPINANPIKKYSLPMFVTPIEDKGIIALVGGSMSALGVAVGDELLTVDGVRAMDFIKVGTKYGSHANDETNKHFVMYATIRPTYMTDIRPVSATSELAVKKPDGVIIKVTVPWQLQKSEPKTTNFANDRHNGAMFLHSAEAFNTAARGSLLALGQMNPFFLTEQTKAKFNIVRVTASDEYLTKYKVDRSTAIPEVFAARYQFNAKNILLIRQPTYEPEGAKWEELIKVYKAILNEYESKTDVLVIDQTHNPGGDSDFLEAFFRLFISEQKANFVQYAHADRKMIYDLDQTALKLDKTLKSEDSRAVYQYAREVEKANDAGAWFPADPIPMNVYKQVGPFADFSWKKPILVVTDELAASCGDVFPMLMQKNGIAKIFGKRTMGAGGSVELVAELTNSRASVQLTRGLITIFSSDGKYPVKEFIENNGVQPDLPYEHTIKDFRDGFVAYVTAISQAAVAQIKVK